MKILITSDNHLGYKERDTIRSMDSFHTFEEILCYANIYSVDVIIQGGDLFHDNRPSRFTMANAVDLIRKYTLGDKSISFSCNSSLNYDDPNLNVSIPIIAIHGNHDDPSGIFGISALDVLGRSGLINYVGKIKNLDSVRIDPVIFDNQIAIYPIGYVRDRRLYRMLIEKKVNFMKPVGEYYHLLLLHQNRVAYGPKEHIPPEFLPEWMDMVVYGHEHTTGLVSSERFQILQPGSTVRTTLTEKELGDKFVYILDTANGGVEKIKLLTVRKFSIENVDLNGGVSSNDTVNSEKIVEEKIGTALKRMEDEEAPCIEQFGSGGSSFGKRISELVEMKRVPLLRVKVHLGPKNDLNRFKIGEKFDKMVANHSEILSISRKRNTSVLSKDEVAESDVYNSFVDIVRQHLKTKAITEQKFISALSDYIHKDDRNSFTEMVKQSINEILDKLMKGNVDDIERGIRDIKTESCILEEITADSMLETADDDERCTFTELL